jgi:hypothetical protein
MYLNLQPYRPPAQENLALERLDESARPVVVEGQPGYNSFQYDWAKDYTSLSWDGRQIQSSAAL